MFSKLFQQLEEKVSYQKRQKKIYPFETTKKQFYFKKTITATI
jgi:hypothetical protein